MKIPFIGQTGEDLDVAVSYQKTQNWYVHISKEGKSEVSLLPTPGLTHFATTVTGPIRGSIVYNDLLYVISSNTVYSITSAGAATSRGTISTSTGRVIMAHNGAAGGGQILIADGTDGYICDGAATAAIADAQFPPNAGGGAPTHVVFFDGYFIVNDPANVGRFYVSGSYDGTAWEALDFATAERDPDKLQSILTSNRILWFIGEYTSEPWFNGGGTFPFEPVQSGFIEWGTPAKYSPAQMDGNVFFLGQTQNGQVSVVQIAGMQPQVISNAIAGNLKNLTTLSDAYGYCYQYNGHAFYVLTFPTDAVTLVYDIATQMWHEWNHATTGYHISSCHSFLYGKHLVGSNVDGVVYYLDWDNYTDDGERITRIRHSRHIHAEDKAVRHEGVWVDIKEGVGDSTTTDPQIMLRYKDNDGAWSNEKWRSMGAQGAYGTRAIWRRLGRSRNRIYEIKVTDPVQAVIIDAYAKVEADKEELK